MFHLDILPALVLIFESLCKSLEKNNVYPYRSSYSLLGKKKTFSTTTGVYQKTKQK